MDELSPTTPVTAKEAWKLQSYAFREDLSSAERLVLYTTQSPTELCWVIALRVVAQLLNSFSPVFRGHLLPRFYGHPVLEFIEIECSVPKLVEVCKFQGMKTGQQWCDLIMVLLKDEQFDVSIEHVRRTIGVKWDRKHGRLFDEVVSGVLLTLNVNQV